MKFHECVNEAEVKSVLTNPLRSKLGDPKPKGQLKDGVAESFETILGCLKFCGGMDMMFFRRLTANSNEYAEKRVNRGNFVGYKWTPISVEEMIRFFGIMLKISI